MTSGMWSDDGSGLSDAAPFAPALRAWYRRHGRHALPWRQTRDPYAVLVSEVMLQQTQVDRVLPHYERWISRWPSVQELAAAPVGDVIRAWSGLGYNRRAVFLHRAATAVQDSHGDGFPNDITELRRLPGVGPYTAAAIASFAFEQRVAVADTNIARVIGRSVYGVAQWRDVRPAAIKAAAGEMLPARGARDHNLALMDLGALVCRARGPLCGECPLRRGCAWQAAGRPASGTGAGPAARFESTARYARGRIIEALREHASLDGAALAMLLPADHRERVPEYLTGLEKDGLIAGCGGRWALPRAEVTHPVSQSRSMASPKL